jgi:hypothetical protein
MAAFWVEYKEILAVVMGAILGFALSEGKSTWLLRKRRKSHFGALRAQIELCREMAETYLRDNIIAPLYRLPLSAYENSMPALLADGALNETEVRALTEFFAQVQTLNRGLDLAQTMRERGEDQMLQEEFARNQLKAERLVPSEIRPASYYDRAIAVITSRV